MTLVDCPGIGENEEMTRMVKEYIPKASGFIYIINAANAGGIQPDRVCIYIRIRLGLLLLFCKVKMQYLLTDKILVDTAFFFRTPKYVCTDKDLMISYTALPILTKLTSVLLL